MATIKAVISDLDGTLIEKKIKDGKESEECFISDYNRKIIEAIKERGIRFGVATGRSPNLLYNVERLDELIDLPIATNNGATIFSHIGGELLDDYPIDKECHSFIIDIAKKI